MRYQEILAEAVGGIRAYHGTGHRFDRFDLIHTGTGEGFDAFGHGIYFAENYEVAKFYSDMIGQPNPKRPQAVATIYQVAIQTPRGTLLDWDTVWSRQSAYIRKRVDPADVEPRTYNSLSQRADGKWVWNGKEEFAFDTKQAAQGLFKRANEVLGSSFYGALATRLGGKQAASAYLQERGIPGLCYFDEGSRELGQGTRNFVIWDTGKINITRVIRPDKP